MKGAQVTSREVMAVEWTFRMCVLGLGVGTGEVESRWRVEVVVLKRRDFWEAGRWKGVEDMVDCCGV